MVWIIMPQRKIGREVTAFHIADAEKTDPYIKFTFSPQKQKQERKKKGTIYVKLFINSFVMTKPMFLTFP